LKDGNPVYACSILAIDAEGSEITTIEGIGTPEALHPLQEAFIEHDATQCGFCTPGFIVACKALLDRKPDLTEHDLRDQLGGNLCRCGTYRGIREAVAALAKGGSNA
jgi:aerobic-type carbon monoxide dehydrogenase small subunit (CoxS/CutS family)